MLARFRLRSRRPARSGRLADLFAAGDSVFGVTGALDAMFSVDEGRRGGVHVLVSRGCDPSGSFLDASGPLIERFGVRWIPVGLGLSEDRQAVAAAIEGGGDAIRAFMRGDPPPDPSARAQTFALWQEEFYLRELEVELADGKGGVRPMPVIVLKDQGGDSERMVSATQALPLLAAMLEAEATW